METTAIAADQRTRCSDQRTESVSERFGTGKCGEFAHWVRSCPNNTHATTSVTAGRFL